MSNVFHWLPHVHNHLSSLRGDQPHSGQRSSRLAGLLIVKLVLWNNDRIVSDRSHARYYDLYLSQDGAALRVGSLHLTFQPIQYVTAQRMSGWQFRMIEIVGRIVRHSQPLHYPARSGVRQRCEGYQLVHT